MNKNRDRRLKEAHAKQERRELKEIFLHNGRELCGERGPGTQRATAPNMRAHVLRSPRLEGGLDLGADVEDLPEPRNRRPSPSVLVLVPLAVSLVWDPLFDAVHRRRGFLLPRQAR